MRNNDGLLFQLLRLWLQRRQGRLPQDGGLFGRSPRRLRLRRRRGPLRSLLRLVLIVVALVLIVRACHTREVEETPPATIGHGGDASEKPRATWL